jgi:hypothetical protein
MAHFAGTVLGVVFRVVVALCVYSWRHRKQPQRAGHQRAHFKLLLVNWVGGAKGT